MKNSLAAAAVLLSVMASNAQDYLTNKEGSDYRFEVIHNLERTSVKNQFRSGTCWSFSALSFFESELIRMGKQPADLSEMFVVRHAYEGKADKYVRMHGKSNFGAGGAFHDIPWVIRRYGIVPDTVYPGLHYGTEKHVHSEMDEILLSVVETVVKNPNRKLTPVWKDAYGGILDAYLGELPETFKVDGKTHTAKSYADDLGLNMDDYVSITSWTNHPFYSEVRIAIPDNWAWGASYNVPLDDMIRVLDEALANGYTLAWGADVSEKGFSFRDGLALVPEHDSLIRVRGQDNKHFSDAGAMKDASCFGTPSPEKEITQEMRQEAYDNYETQDDHGMHITGMVKDQNGTKYYIVKNSWGTGNQCDGYFYASEAYIKYKTINLYLHKDGLPKDIKKKLSLK